MIRRFFRQFRAEILVSYLVIGIGLAAVLLTVAQVWPGVDIFSLGQMLLEFLLIPVAIVGLLFAAEQYRKSQARPDVDLYWLHGSRGLTRDLGIDHVGNFTNHPEEGRYTGKLAVMNQGNAICEWFQVVISVPLDLSGPDDFIMAGPDDSEQIPTISWHRSVGEDSNWEETVEEFRHYRILFRSNGLIASYVDEPLILGSADLWPPAIEKDKTFKVPYKIVTNAGARNEGELLVSIRVAHLH